MSALWRRTSSSNCWKRLIPLMQQSFAKHFSTHGGSFPGRHWTIPTKNCYGRQRKWRRSSQHFSNSRTSGMLSSDAWLLMLTN